MATVYGLAGVLLILFVLWEGFETVVLPRRVTRRFRLTTFFYRRTWLFWSRIIHTFSSGRQQETLLSFYGPLSLLLLLTVWAGGLVFGFGVLYWSINLSIGDTREVSFLTNLYLSGTTFFTLGLGDIVPRTPMAKIFTVIEAGMGFGFLALIIGYLPPLNSSFSRREVSISLLDARAGSPPRAVEILRRDSTEQGLRDLNVLLREWESWAAEFLEIHLSYPVLAYFRSQHENQSWLSALTAVLDTCALIITSIECDCERQAGLTFAMARHAIVDLALVFRSAPSEPKRNRLPSEELADLRNLLQNAGLKVRRGEAAEQALTKMRSMYEPYIDSLSSYFCITIPPIMSPTLRHDNWQTSAWGGRKTRAKGKVKSGRDMDEHF